MYLEKSYLGAEDGRLNQLERAAVDLDETLAGLALSDSLCFSIQPSAKRGPLGCIVSSNRDRCVSMGPGWWENTDSRVTLLAEALNHLRSSHVCGWFGFGSCRKGRMGDG